MDVLIKSARIIDSGSKFNGKTMDVLIENGIITSIKPKITSNKKIQTIELKNTHLSPGWMDMQVNFCDPGYEHKEDLQSGINAAAAGGFSAVAIVPSTNPPIHTKSQVQYVKKNTKGAIVDVYPIGTLSYQMEGKDLSEMYDMHKAGAIAFSDDKKPVQDSGLLMRALLYSQNFGGIILTHCDEKSISLDGKMNEGEISTKLGLKGMPSLAEELMVNRNIFIAEYTGAPIHLQNISSKKSVELIKQAKAKKIKISASVNAYNLHLDDSALKDFDTNYKLNPPLRTKSDTEALKKAVTDGTIDCITSDHRPQEIETKNIEFDYASNGMIGLETAFALLNTLKPSLKLDTIIKSITHNPRKILQIPIPKIAVGQKANITLFNPELQWTVEAKHIKSKSLNSPYIGKKLKGKVIGIINNDQISVNSF